MSLFVVRWNFRLVSRSSGAIHFGVPIRTVAYDTDMSAKLANPKSAIFASRSLLTSMFAWTTTIAKVHGNVGGSCSPLSNHHGTSLASVGVECPLQSEATGTRVSVSMKPSLSCVTHIFLHSMMRFPLQEFNDSAITHPFGHHAHFTRK
jgi:hypothetical protein